MKSDYRYDVIEFIKTVYQDELAINIVNQEVIDVFFTQLNSGIIFHLMNEEGEKQYLSDNCKNIRNKIIHLWEDQWLFQNSKIRSKLMSIIGKTERIFARKTEIIPIDNKQLMNFLNINHLLVPIKGKHKYGLQYNNRLVAVMSFSKSRIIVREGSNFNSYELLRFCNMLNVTVVGGFSKLLRHFIKINKPDDIMTYVDADWSDGASYAKMGFESVDKMPPMYLLIGDKSEVREYPHLLFEQYKTLLNDDMNYMDKINRLKSIGYNTVKNSGSFKFILKLKSVQDPQV